MSVRPAVKRTRLWTSKPLHMRAHLKRGGRISPLFCAVYVTAFSFYRKSHAPWQLNTGDPEVNPGQPSCHHSRHDLRKERAISYVRLDEAVSQHCFAGHDTDTGIMILPWRTARWESGIRSLWVGIWYPLCSIWYLFTVEKSRGIYAERLLRISPAKRVRDNCTIFAPAGGCNKYGGKLSQSLFWAF